MDPKEIIDVVEELNELCVCAEDTSEEFYWTLKSTGTCSIIEYVGVTMWCSEEDEREFNEEKNEYEPLIDYLIRAQNRLIENLSKLRINPERSGKKCGSEESNQPQADG